MDYIDRLTALRQDRDIGQKMIADLLSCNQSTVSKFERRRTSYTIEDLIMLCQFYHISADYILGLPKGLPYPDR